jgi:hypothetical protein
MGRETTPDVLDSAKRNVTTLEVRRLKEENVNLKRALTESVVEDSLW